MLFFVIRLHIIHAYIVKLFIRILICCPYQYYVKGGQQIWHTLSMPYNFTSFQTFFHCQNHEKFCNSTITKYPTAP